MSGQLSVHSDEIAGHLKLRGLVAASEGLRVEPMTGGVSNDVFAITGLNADMVVKRALGQLRVQQTWLADPARLATEGRALLLAGRFTPEAVPKVLDESDGFLVIARAPHDWRTWKTDLLTGTIAVPIAEKLGTLLGIWQRESARRQPELLEDFGDRTAFRQLRLEPFHYQIRDAHRDLQEAIDLTVKVMAEASVCLVHGDYTPKNVLVGEGPNQVWVIDWEVAHLGDPTFDPAWIVGHLLLKSIRQRLQAPAFHAAARAFLSGLAGIENAVPIDHAQLIRQAGCLVLARVDGRSPVEYLDESQQNSARAIGRRLLTDPPEKLTDIWKDLA
jgi:5-methylthioribose kinase